jgi:hypothetical protein
MIRAKDGDERAKVEGKCCRDRGYFESADWHDVEHARKSATAAVKRGDTEVRILIQKRRRGRWKFDRWEDAP